jgi:phosphohistidine swiveling domain-containing protein
MDVMRRVVELGWRYDLLEVDPDSLDGFQYMAVADTTRLEEEWGFECAWSGRETLRDLARALTRVVYLGRKGVRKPWRLHYARTDIPPDYPPLDGGPLAEAAPPGLAGEFDSKIDSNFPEFFATNLSEAFPGPMTPLSLTVNLDAMHASSDGMCDFLDLPDDVRREMQGRGAAAFGHRMYAGVSIVRKMAEAMPGMTPEDIDHQFLGLPRQPGARPRPSLSEVGQALRLLAHVGPQIAGFGAEADRCQAEARELALPAAALRELPEPRLLAHIALLHDQLCQAWNVACIGNMIAGGALAAAERVGAADATSAAGGDQPLASAGALFGVAELARLAREAPDVAAVLEAGVGSGTLDDVRSIAPWWAARFDDLLVECGHRGPGETELENLVYEDRPDMLLNAVAKALHVRPHEGRPAPSSGVQRSVGRLVGRSMRVRERARDAVVRLTHALRLAARERGHRLAASSVLRDADDVFYLSYQELLDPPSGVIDHVAGRRDERARLQELRLPTMFSSSWTPDDDVPEIADSGHELKGIAASAGVVQGPVRILREAGDLLEPGDILVANVTDTGWTPLFAFAAGVVTDIGGLLSHPTVVAREYGIPCVVGVGDATRRLRDGQIVEVDGSAGTVRVVE